VLEREASDSASRTALSIYLYLPINQSIFMHQSQHVAQEVVDEVVVVVRRAEEQQTTELKRSETPLLPHHLATTHGPGPLWQPHHPRPASTSPTSQTTNSAHARISSTLYNREARVDWDLRLRWAALRARYYFGTSRNPGVGLSTLGLNAATMAFGLSCREWCRGEEVLAIISDVVRTDSRELD